MSQFFFVYVSGRIQQGEKLFATTEGKNDMRKKNNPVYSINIKLITNHKTNIVPNKNLFKALRKIRASF